MLPFAQKFFSLAERITTNRRAHTSDPAPAPLAAGFALPASIYTFAGNGMTSAGFVTVGVKVTRCACAMLCSRRK
jgi:hypothetical protein